MDSDTEKFLEALFMPGEVVATYGPKPSGYIGDPKGDNVYFGPWEQVKPAEYITLNPLSTNVRAAHLIAKYRNFLFEFDNVSLAQQMELLAALGKLIPIRAISFSGNKSYGGIVSLADDLISGPDGDMNAFLYSEYFKRIYRAALSVLAPLVTESYKGHLIDPACSDASRLTRLPGALNRHWKEPTRTPTPQTLISIGALISSHDLETFLAQYEPEQTPTQTIKHALCYNGSFEKTLNNQTHLKGLRNTLLMPESWGGPNGNHPLLYRYTHWAIDATGVSEDEFLSYVTRNTAPYLISLGYPLWKVEEAVKGAYRIRKHRRK